jgi:YD repeat-containing protein
MKSLQNAKKQLCQIVFCLLVAARVDAAPPSWSFNPPVAGRAVLAGGWLVDYPLGGVDACPEFNFPLQLVYLSTRSQQGLFGSAWFCPQLETTILPVAKGVLLWTMPSGDQVVLRQNPDRISEYRSADRQWKAEAYPSKQKISNEEGWVYQYSRGKLIGVVSPGNRMLEFEWQNNHLQGVQVRNLVTNVHRLVLVALYGENKRLASVNLDGQLHQFRYRKDGNEDRLAAWEAPVGETVKFLYHPETGVLVKTGIGDTEDSLRVEEFKTQFVDPKKNGSTTIDDFAAKKQPCNYWLVKDQNCSYIYGRKGKELKQWDPSDVTLKFGTGLVQQSSYAENRGIMTTQQDGADRKSYYYRAPGQKYDGKLRRVEVNGSLVADYRYDRKTGLLTEVIDGRGSSTFYDYDPKFRVSLQGDWDTKPLRVRRGTRRKSEIVAEYVYDETGKVLAAKDGHGNLTKYTYTSCNDIASVTNPNGETVAYTYDDFGRCTSASSDGRTERVEYDGHGRVKSRISPDGVKTEMLYDTDGQITQMKRNGKVTKELVRDAFHRIVGEKDSLNRLSRITRDARGNLLAQIAPNGSITRYEYDDYNRRIAQIDGNGHKITFEYDPAGRMIKQVNALGNEQTWKYDPKTGKLLERSNGVQLVRHAYNKDGRMTSIDYGDGQKITYTYDKDGRLLSANGPDSTFEHSYDDDGHPAATRAILGEEEHLLSYRYNNRGQRTGLMISKFIPKSPSEFAHYEPIQQTEQLFDAKGRLASILSNSVPAISYRYDAAGRTIQKTYGLPDQGALTAGIAYDSAGHLARMEFSGGRLTAPLVLTYEWDECGQLTRRTWHGQSQRYQYDPSGQLLKVTDEHDNSVLEAYRYDLAGNMLAKYINGQLTAMTYNAGNQLENSYDFGSAKLETLNSLPTAPAGLERLATSTLAYHYDHAGRMLGTGTKPQNSYGWLDKLTRVTLSEGGQSAHYYWPDGQLATVVGEGMPAFTKPPPPESFLWDGLALIKRNDTLYLIEPHPSGGVPIASHPVGKPDEITYHLNDLLGTTLATVGPNGVHFSSLTSFGQPLKAADSDSPATTSGPNTPTNPVPQPHRLPATRR